MTSFAPVSVLVLALFGLLVMLSAALLAARVERRAHASAPADPEPLTLRSSV